LDPSAGVVVALVKLVLLAWCGATRSASGAKRWPPHCCCDLPTLDGGGLVVLTCLAN
jgi:hypothetical protein